MLTLESVLVVVALSSGCLALAQALAHPLRQRREALRRRDAPPGLIDVPRTSVIMPCDGHGGAALLRTLQGLTSQRASALEVICVTRKSDEAVRSACAAFPGARHVVAGDATTCCQKNHNLLAGLEASDGPDLLVFCDADALVPDSGWLERMSRPLLTGADAALVATTTFRQVSVESALPSLIYKVCTDFQFNSMALIDTFVWGGAMVIKAADFHALELDKAWREAVVDDIVSARVFKQARRRVGLAYDALLDEPGGERSLGWVFGWATRQLQFLRYVLPGAFLLALAFYALVASSLLIPAALLLSGHAESCGAALQACLLATLAHIVSMAILVRAYPARHRIMTALIAPFAAVMALGAGLAACVLVKLDWGKHSYVVGRDGQVESLSKAESRRVPVGTR